MTTNRLDLLKPAVYRKGRVDEVFFVDHPTPERFVQLLNQTSEIKDHIIKTYEKGQLVVGAINEINEATTIEEVDKVIISSVTTPEGEEK